MKIRNGVLSSALQGADGVLSSDFAVVMVCSHQMMVCSHHLMVCSHQHGGVLSSRTLKKKHR
jgi:hypothetical protein